MPESPALRRVGRRLRERSASAPASGTKPAAWFAASYGGAGSTSSASARSRSFSARRARTRSMMPENENPITTKPATASPTIRMAEITWPKSVKPAQATPAPM